MKPKKAGFGGSIKNSAKELRGRARSVVLKRKLLDTHGRENNLKYTDSGWPKEPASAATYFLMN